MANPSIQSVVVTYPGAQTSLQPGQSCTIQVTATDSDTRNVQISLVVTDNAGHAQTGSATVVVIDPLTYEATVLSGGGSVVPDGSVPGKFTYTA